MISINTNLSSFIAQNSLKTSTNKLNETVERMSTGYKINHAKDNAANYSISTNMTTKLGAYQVAEDNTAMGMDMLTTATESLGQIENKLTRLRALATQAQNGTYGEQSKNAINTEANSITDEIERLYYTASFNGINLLHTPEYNLPDCAEPKWGNFLIEPIKEETEGYIVKSLTEAFIEGSFDPNVKYSISSSEELNKFAEMVSNSISTSGVTFFLENDIDLSADSTFNTIGSGIDKFNGIFNGNGYKITNYKGSCLFYYNEGTIKNIGIEKFELSRAGIAGSNDGSIDNCFVADGSIKSEDSAGGIVALNYKEIANCYVDADIEGKRWVGGIAGYSSSLIKFYNNHSTGAVKSGAISGGLIGLVNISSSTGRILNSTSISNVSSLAGMTGSFIGGWANSRDGVNYANLELINCYSAEQNLPTIGASYIYGGGVNYTLDLSFDLTPFSSMVKVLHKQKTNVDLQISINSDCSSNLNIELGFKLFDTSILRNIGHNDSEKTLNLIDSYLLMLSEKQTELGSVSNRLESVLDEIATQYDNLVSSRSTLRDADMAELSSTYIQQQILQEASATLMATANQMPAIALQLL